MRKPDSSLKILILEDDPTDRYYTKHAFDRSDLPVSIHFLTSGDGLLSVLRQMSQDSAVPIPLLIIVNLFPFYLFEDTMGKLRSLPGIYRNSLVVATFDSAWEWQEEAKSGWEVAEFIQKPLTPQKLESVIGSLQIYRHLG